MKEVALIGGVILAIVIFWFFRNSPGDLGLRVAAMMAILLLFMMSYANLRYIKTPEDKYKDKKT